MGQSMRSGKELNKEVQPAKTSAIPRVHEATTSDLVGDGDQSAKESKGGVPVIQKKKRLQGNHLGTGRARGLEEWEQVFSRLIQIHAERTREQMLRKQRGTVSSQTDGMLERDGQSSNLTGMAQLPASDEVDRTHLCGFSTRDAICSLLPEELHPFWPIIEELTPEAPEKYEESLPKGMRELMAVERHACSDLSHDICDTKRLLLLSEMLHSFANRYGPVLVLQHLRTGTSKFSGAAAAAQGVSSPGMEILYAISELCNKDRSVENVVTIAGKKRVFKRRCPPIVLAVVSRTILGKQKAGGFERVRSHAERNGALLHLRALSKDEREKHMCNFLGANDVSMPLAALVSGLAAGNPAYTEAVCAALMDRKLIEKHNNKAYLVDTNKLNKREKTNEKKRLKRDAKTQKKEEYRRAERRAERKRLRKEKLAKMRSAKANIIKEEDEQPISCSDSSSQSASDSDSDISVSSVSSVSSNGLSDSDDEEEREKQTIAALDGTYKGASSSGLGHLVFDAPQMVKSGQLATYEQMPAQHQEVVKIAACMGRVFPLRALRQVMETRVADGGREWEKGRLDKCLEELVLGDIIYHYVPEMDYPCNIDHELLKQYDQISNKLKANDKMKSGKVTELGAGASLMDLIAYNMGGGTDVVVDGTYAGQKLFAGSMLLAFSSNVLLDLALEMTTKSRRSELMMPLSVALTVKRATKRFLKKPKAQRLQRTRRNSLVGMSASANLMGNFNV